MTRIALISPYTLPTKRGNSLTAERLKNSLQKKGFQVTLFNSSKDSPLKAAEFSPDLIHCLHGTRSNTFITELLTHISVPLITTLTGTDYNIEDGSNKLSADLSNTLEISAAIITFNCYAKKILCDFSPEISEKISIIPQSVEIRHNSGNRTYIRKRYGCLQNDIIILMAGGIRSVKNINFAIDACKHLEKLYHNLKLILVGPIIEQDTADRIITNGNKLKCFSYPGELSHQDTRELMFSSDIFLNTSINEGMSGAILDAMYENLPIIASDNPGNAAILEDEKTGFLVPLNDTAILENRLMQLIDNKSLRIKIGAAGKQLVKCRYSEKNEIESHLNLYHKLLRNSHDHS